MVGLVVFVVAAMALSAVWLACGGASAAGRAQSRAVRRARREDQARLRDLWRQRD